LASKIRFSTAAASGKPLMRRMNSMLSGHHGASSRTAPMYFWIVSMVAGSRQLSGRWTMREGIVKSSRSPRRSSASISAARAAA
jgi:hypothetical protein